MIKVFYNLRSLRVVVMIMKKTKLITRKFWGSFLQLIGLEYIIGMLYMAHAVWLIATM